MNRADIGNVLSIHGPPHTFANTFLRFTCSCEWAFKDGQATRGLVRRDVSHGSRVTRHTSRVTHHVSHVTRHAGHAAVDGREGTAADRGPDPPPTLAVPGGEWDADPTEELLAWDRRPLPAGPPCPSANTVGVTVPIAKCFGSF